MAEVPNPMPSLICRSRHETRLEVSPCPRYAAVVSTAEKLFEKAQALPESAQAALLKLVEVLATTPPAAAPKPKPQFGSARGLITIGPDFDEPLEDFKTYME